jgi:uncharacterized protein (DUF608 family)
MSGQSRREFLRTAGAAAAAIGVPQAGAGGGRYARSVLKHQSLRGYWRLDGSLAAALGGGSLAPHGGSPTFVEGPVGKAVALGPGKFLALAGASGLESDQTSVELFFQLTGSLPSNYNPCLIAQRSSSPSTRFSLHIMSDASGLALWNGHSVARIAMPVGKIEIGQWVHVVIVSRPGSLAVFLDGVAATVTDPGASFDLAQKGLPLVLGASDTSGSEACPCAISDVAIYGAALVAADVAEHVKAAGWAARSRKLAEEFRRREMERRRMERAEVAARLRDPRLMAAGEQRVYRGDNLTGVLFPVGGIGAGAIQINGRAERAIWQIFNNFTAGVLPNSFFAVSAARAGAAPVVRALQTSRVGPFPAMADLEFRGEYPLGWFDFIDPDVPVRICMEAFTPLVPLDSRASALPAACFAFKVDNPSAASVDVSLLGAQQNAVGYDGHSIVLDRMFGGYGGNTNAIRRLPECTLLQMDREGGLGQMALMAMDPAADGVADWGSLSALKSQLASGQPLSGAREAGPSPSGQTLDGAIVSRFTLKPGESRTVVFWLAWHFPHAIHGGDIAGWSHKGNRYAEWWPDIAALVEELAANGAELSARTHAFHDAVYASNLPRFLLDRVTSQVAILRSKTCYWAGDGYFGGWEGCAPASGCCAGNCAHVWHYAQAHARLFPDIARKMREQVFADQFPDGGLPHRQPGEFPAADGLLGDILGAYREHLCQEGGDWLKSMWPGVRKAMDYAIHRWDADEDGVLAGPQWNTLDGALGGNTSWIGTLYLAALAASARMAALQGDTGIAERYLRIRRSGATKQDAALWNGEYYIQVRDAQPEQDYGTGCEIDQVLGEWWARQLGLDPAYPLDHVRSALASLIRYNFRPNFRGVTQAPRKFVDDDDAAMQMIHWPDGKRPAPTILYGDEVMTGFEYAACAAMIQVGMLREGLMVVLAAHDRYDGRLRTGLTEGGYASWGYSGNPFGDDECGKFYARAMSAWSLLLAAQGFVYDGPAARIGFKPVWRPNDHISFFTAAEGWGIFRQTRRAGVQRAAIELRSGHLTVEELVFALPKSAAPVRARVSGPAGELPCGFAGHGDDVRIALKQPFSLKAGEKLLVEMA